MSIQVNNTPVNIEIQSNPIDVIIEPKVIDITISGARGPKGDPGNDLFYTTTLGSVLTITIAAATHEISSVNNVIIYHPDGREVSVQYSVINNDVILESNINLLNHVIKIY